MNGGCIIFAEFVTLIRVAPLFCKGGSNISYLINFVKIYLASPLCKRGIEGIFFFLSGWAELGFAPRNYRVLV